MTAFERLRQRAVTLLHRPTMGGPVTQTLQQMPPRQAGTLWIVVAIGEHAEAVLSVFHPGEGWWPVIFTSLEEADRYLGEPGAPLLDMAGERLELRTYTYEKLERVLRP